MLQYQTDSEFLPNVSERGAFAFVSQILNPGEDDQMNCGLREIDLSVNQIGFYGVFEIEKRLKERSGKIEQSWMQKTNKGDKKEFERQIIEVDLEGNMVFQEVRSFLWIFVPLYRMLTSHDSMLDFPSCKGHELCHSWAWNSSGNDWNNSSFKPSEGEASTFCHVMRCLLRISTCPLFEFNPISLVLRIVSIIETLFFRGNLWLHSD